MIRAMVVLGVLCAWVVFADGQGQCQKIKVGPAVIASAPKGGWHPWYEIHVDPDDADNMLICGTKRDPKDNGPSGFVYYSADGGATWMHVLQDKSSAWVTEQSCAYGVNGVAYFVSDASKVIDDAAHHDLGTTRIYTSRDSGRTWRVGITTGWTDHSTSVVNTRPGPNQNRVYVFFNGLNFFYHSLGQIEAETTENENRHATHVGMISFKEGDTQIRGPVTSRGVAEQTYEGSYPSSAFLLKNGSIVAFYTSGHGGENAVHRLTVEVVRVDNGRSALDTAVEILDSSNKAAEIYDYPSCAYSVDNSASAYDPIHNELYLLYPALYEKECHLFLTTSIDNGGTWAKSEQLISPDAIPASKYYSPALAINQEGIVAAMWKETLQSGCWMFAVADNSGGLLSRAQHLGVCGAEQKKLSTLSTAYLWTVIDQAGAFGSTADGARIILRDTRNAVARNVGAIAITPDGVFHPAWIDAGDGNGEIRTAAIHVTSVAALIASGTKGLADITSKVAVRYGGYQHYDARSGIINVDVVIRNRGASSIRGPLKLVVPRLNKDYEHADIANADNKATGAGAMWDISASVPGGTLGAGATSRPFPLQFRYHPEGNQEQLIIDGDFLDLNLKVFAKSQ